MSTQLNILVVDDEESTRKFLHTVLTAEGHRCFLSESLDGVEELLRQQQMDLALVDLYLGTTNGLNVLDLLRVMQPQCKAVIMTAHATLETVTRSLGSGALDYLSKPLLIDELLALAGRIQSNRPVETVVESAGPAPDTAIIGRSPKMLEVYRAIARVAPSDASVLIVGASGTGKELVARAIHAHSPRASKPFVPVNCGAFSETLLESELFGYEKGAFTGASADHAGLFESADVRILAATNKDVHGLIEAGSFREDLYYRLSVVTIQLPALADRREDIPLLVRHFLKISNAKNKKDIRITAPAVQLLRSMSWPGNVRELENFIERLSIFCASGEIGAGDVEREASTKRKAPAIVALGEGNATLLDMERQHILRVLEETHGNKARAARALGIERKTLYEKAKRMGIDLQPKKP